jgi:(2Fe-2S) ferredoxin
MTRLTTRAELDAARARLAGAFDPHRTRVFVCMGTGCKAAGGDAILAGLESALAGAGLGDRVELVMTGCRGFCENGALVAVRPPGTLYCRVAPADIPEIVERTVVRSEVVERLNYALPPVAGETAPRRVSAEEEIPFYRHQTRLLLGMNDRIDPTRIEDYIREGGYAGLARALFDLSPDGIIDEVERPACAAAAAAASPPGRSGSSARARRATRSTSSATPTRATRARSWTGRCSRATRTRARGHGIGATPSAPPRLRLLPRRVPLAIERLRAGHRAGAARPVCWARTSWAAASSFDLRSSRAPAPSSAARRRR